MRSQSRPGICELKEAELVKPHLGGVQPLAEVPVGETRHEGVHVGVGARLSLLATEGLGGTVYQSGGRPAQGSRCTRFCSGRSVSDHKKICLLKNGMLISHLAIFEM